MPITKQMFAHAGNLRANCTIICANAKKVKIFHVKRIRNNLNHTKTFGSTMSRHKFMKLRTDPIIKKSKKRFHNCGIKPFVIPPRSFNEIETIVPKMDAMMKFTGPTGRMTICVSAHAEYQLGSPHQMPRWASSINTSAMPRNKSRDANRMGFSFTSDGSLLAITD